MTEIKRKGENTEERMEMAYEGARGYFRQGLNWDWQGAAGSVVMYRVHQGQ